MLERVGFDEVRQVDQRRNPRNEYTEWASFQAVKT